MLTPTVRFK